MMTLPPEMIGEKRSDKAAGAGYHDFHLDYSRHFFF